MDSIKFDKLLLKILLMVILFIAGDLNSVQAQTEVHNFRLKNLNNRTVSYKQLKGDSLTVIDFWATWCKPCVKSIPKLVDMYDQLKDQGVQFIGISVDGPRNQSKIKPFSKSLGIDYPVLLDQENNVMSRLRVNVVPTLLIINRKDKIVHYSEGYTAGEEKIIKQTILKYLNQ